MRTEELHIASVGDPVRHEAAAWFARLRADDVSERERVQFQHWLAASNDHREAYERLEVLWSRLGTHAGTPEIAAALRASQVQRQSVNNGRNRARRRVMACGAAAALLLAVFAGSWMVWQGPQAIQRTYATGTGEQRTLVLEDGSRVTLDTDTRLSTAYSSNVRRLTLERGRAFFRVAKNPNRPFLVSTPDGVVRATGTQFEIYERDGSVEITLVEGRVIVTSDSAANRHGIATTMQAGQRLLMGKGFPEPILETAQTDITTAWLSGKLVFNDTPLPEAIAEFNRYASNKLVIADDTLKRMHVTGVFHTDDSRAFVDALHVSYGVSVTPGETGGIVLAATRHPNQARR